MPKIKKILRVVMDEKQFEEVRKLAFKKRISISALSREAIDNYLKVK